MHNLQQDIREKKDVVVSIRTVLTLLYFKSGRFYRKFNINYKIA